MKRLLISICCFAGLALAGEWYYVEIDPATMVETSSFAATNQITNMITGDRLLVEITKIEYLADKDVAPEDRLKNIDPKKVSKSVIVSNYLNFAAEKAYAEECKNVLPRTNGLRKSQWLQIWKDKNPVTSKAVEL